MRAEYCVEPTVKVRIDPAWERPEKMCINGADVNIEVSEDNFLKKVKVVYTGLPVKSIEVRDEYGKGILTSQGLKELASKAYKVMSYILNYIQIEGNVYIFDTRELKNIQPDISTENPDEEQYLSTRPKRCYSLVCGSLVAVACVRFDNIEKRFNHAKAYANFADAKNTQNPITKYESLYKVIEYFCNGRGEEIDQSVSDFMRQYESTFISDHFKELRLFRNRCMHPRKNDDHISSSDIELTEELVAKAGRLEQIAELLLKHK